MNVQQKTDSRPPVNPFPVAVQMRLRQAARCESPVDRAREIDKAVEWARLRYPECFRPEAAPA